MKMQTLDLKKMGLIPTKEIENRQIDGGIFGLDDFLIAVAAGLVISAVDHWSDIKSGISDAIHRK